MDYVRSFANGSTFMEISKSSFKTLQLILPPEKLRNQFQIIIDPYFNKIKTNHLQIRILTSLRDTLLPKLMSGDVYIKI